MPKPLLMSPRRGVLQVLIWALPTALLTFLILTFAIDSESVRRHTAGFGILQWIVVLSLSALGYGIRFVRWELYLRALGYHVGIGRSLLYYLAGFAFTITPAKVGEGIRSVLLSKVSVRYADSLSALFVERLIDVAAVALLSLLVVLAMPDAWWGIAAGGASVLVVLAVLSREKTSDRLAQARTSSRLTPWFRRAAELLMSARVLTRPGILYTSLGLALAAWAVEGLGFHMVLVFLGVPLDSTLAIGIYAIALLAGALSFIPGGLGSTEAVMVGLLVATSMDGSTAITATLICRVATLWFAVSIGLLALTASATPGTSALSQNENVSTKRIPGRD